MCITEGDNIVWNDTRSQPLRQVGEEGLGSSSMDKIIQYLGHKRLSEGVGADFEPVEVDVFGKAIAEQTTANKTGNTNYFRANNLCRF